MTYSRVPALVAVAIGAFPVLMAGQECPAGRIASIQVASLDEFDLDEFKEGSFVRGVFHTANTIRINTSESYVLSELLNIDPGG